MFFALRFLETLRLCMFWWGTGGIVFCQVFWQFSFTVPLSRSYSRSGMTECPIRQVLKNDYAKMFEAVTETRLWKQKSKHRSEKCLKLFRQKTFRLQKISLNWLPKKRIRQQHRKRYTKIKQLGSSQDFLPASSKLLSQPLVKNVLLTAAADGSLRSLHPIELIDCRKLALWCRFFGNPSYRFHRELEQRS